MFVTHKLVIPKFVDIYKKMHVSVDSREAKKFVNLAVLHKHFKVIDNKVIFKKHHPDWCVQSSIQNANKFLHKNKPTREFKQYNFLKNYIIKENSLQRFLTLENGISLERFLNPTTAINEMKSIFKQLNLTGFSYQLVQETYNIWRDRQVI